MNLKQALERIEALERRVRELEARPEQHIHYHTHPAQQPYPAPLPQYPYPNPVLPWTPMPWDPWDPWYSGPITIGGGSSN